MSKRKIDFRPLKGALAKKLIFAIVILSSLLAFIITAIQLYVDYRSDINNVHRKLTDIERGYSESISENVWILNDKQISRQLNGLVAIPDVFSAVITVDGKVRWGENAFDTEAAYPEHYLQHQFLLVKRYKQKDRIIGELVLLSSLDEIYSSLYDKIILIFLTNTLKTFLVSIFVFFFFYFYITRHLYKLSDYAKEIKLGGHIEPLQFDRADKIDSKKDELDHLSDAINLMRNNLNESYSYINQANEQLRQELDINKKINIELTESTILVDKKERELDSIINNLVEGVIILDEEFMVLRVNHACKRIFQYNDDEFIQINLNAIIPEININKVERKGSSGPLIIEGFQNIYYGISKDDNRFPLRLSLVALPENGETIYICTFLDITKELQKEEQLQRIRKMDALGKLTGGIAHDYNNMLGVILCYAELLKFKVEKQPELAKYADTIQHAAERGAKLTEKLLDFSRHKSSNAEVLNINTVLRDEQHILEKTLTARIELILDLADDLWPTRVDSSDFEDSILNMSINAMHAIEGNGRLTIQTHNKQIEAMDAQLLNLKPGDYILLKITDSGCGMNDEVKEKIFDPFYSTKGEQGTGLGLSQVYGFVERSGGVIKVHSEHGHGSSFELYFPRYLENKQLEFEQVTDADQVTDTKGNETILVVDDEPALLNLSAEILNNQGYHVICAQSASEALELLEYESVDLLFSDVIMPEMDGYELAGIVQEKYPVIKILLASGFCENQNTNMRNDYLHKNLLQKPYDSQNLLKRIRELLE